MELITMYLNKEEEKRKRAQLDLERQRGWREEGEMLRYKREELGLTPSQMASDIGFSISEVINLEDGNAVKNRELLCQLYTMRVDYQEVLVENLKLTAMNKALIAQLNQKDDLSRS